MNTLYQGATLCGLSLGLLFHALVVTRHAFLAAGLLGLVASALTAWTDNFSILLMCWALSGLTAGVLTVSAHTLVLRNLNFRAIAVAESILMLFTTLVPLGIYPQLLSILAEENFWRYAFAIQIIPYALLIAVAMAIHWPVSQTSKMHPVSLAYTAVVWLILGCISFILLRGERYNWLDSEIVRTSIQVTTFLCLALLLLTVLPRYRPDSMSLNKTLSRTFGLYMFDAAVAGFAVFGSTLLINSFATAVLNYSLLEAGKLHVVGFVGMLMGLIVSLFLTISPHRDPMKVIPVGVALVLLSSYWFSTSTPGSGIADMWPALLLRGIAVGILNVSLTVHIFRSFALANIPQGVALFYLCRSLGSMIAGAVFGRLVYIETENADLVLRQTAAAEPGTSALSQWLAAPQVLVTLSAEIRHQALAIGVINGFRWFIIVVLIIVPVMLLLVLWSKRERRNAQGSRPLEGPGVATGWDRSRGVLVQANSKPDLRDAKQSTERD